MRLARMQSLQSLLQPVQTPICGAKPVSVHSVTFWPLACYAWQSFPAAAGTLFEFLAKHFAQCPSCDVWRVLVSVGSPGPASPHAARVDESVHGKGDHAPNRDQSQTRDLYCTNAHHQIRLRLLTLLRICGFPNPVHRDFLWFPFHYVRSLLHPPWQLKKKLHKKYTIQRWCLVAWICRDDSKVQGTAAMYVLCIKMYTYILHTYLFNHFRGDYWYHFSLLSLSWAHAELIESWFPAIDWTKHGNGKQASHRVQGSLSSANACVGVTHRNPGVSPKPELSYRPWGYIPPSRHARQWISPPFPPSGSKKSSQIIGL